MTSENGMGYTEMGRTEKSPQRFPVLKPSPTTESDAADGSPSPRPDAPALTGNDLLLWSALPDLTLNIAQTASLCGVSVRQLGYWTKQGYVNAAGRGARRLYGPDALRRILAICHAMHSGLSLRQALRSLEDPTRAVLTPPVPISITGMPAVPSQSPADAVALAASLLTLFDRNGQTRDNAVGLAAKLGRNVSDVRRIAERLAGQGALTALPTGDEAVYVRAEGNSF